jgi:hypothetical protein
MKEEGLIVPRFGRQQHYSIGVLLVMMVITLMMFLWWPGVGQAAEPQEPTQRGEWYLISDYGDVCIYMNTSSFSSNWDDKAKSIPSEYTATFKHRLIGFSGSLNGILDSWYEIKIVDKKMGLKRTNSHLYDSLAVTAIDDDKEFVNISNPESPGYRLIARVLGYDIQRHLKQ